jgi:hypothetical protein
VLCSASSKSTRSSVSATTTSCRCTAAETPHSTDQKKFLPLSRVPSTVAATRERVRYEKSRKIKRISFECLLQFRRQT